MTACACRTVCVCAHLCVCARAQSMVSNDSLKATTHSQPNANEDTPPLAQLQQYLTPRTHFFAVQTCFRHISQHNTMQHNPTQITQHNSTTHSTTAQHSTTPHNTTHHLQQHCIRVTAQHTTTPHNTTQYTPNHHNPPLQATCLLV